nr:Gfo/Idh/MocA family oxidoreductase [Jannaschia sp. Os4]
MVAETHVAAVRGAGLELAWAMGRDAAKARRLAARWGCRAVGAPEAADFVILATPPDARADLIDACVAARLPVLSEKPLERDLPRARALVERMEAAALPFGAVLQHRMRGAARALAARLPALGPVRTVDLRVPWWRPQGYYDAPGRGTFARDGGGVLITQAIHALDLMLHLCGPVEAVSALTATAAHDMEAEDFAAAALRFRSGAVGSAMASVTHYPGGTESLTINAAGGSAVLEGDRLTVTTEAGAETLGGGGGTGGGADPLAFSHEWHQAVIADFAGALRDGRAPAIPARDALQVHALIDAVQRAGRERREVAV